MRAVRRIKTVVCDFAYSRRSRPPGGWTIVEGIPHTALQTGRDIPGSHLRKPPSDLRLRQAVSGELVDLHPFLRGEMNISWHTPLFSLQRCTCK